MDQIVLSRIAWEFNFHEMHQNQNISFVMNSFKGTFIVYEMKQIIIGVPLLFPED